MTPMKRAVSLARQAMGTTSPNPAVGAVVVKDGVVPMARTAAIGDMMEKANQVANLTGVELGKLINISETGGQPRASFDSRERLSFATAAKSSPTTIMGGELEVSVTVQALYAIK